MSHPVPDKGTPQKNLVFVDGDWLAVAAQAGKIPVDYGQLMALIRSRFGDSVSVHIYLSVQPKRRDAEILIDELQNLGYTVHQMSVRIAGKSNIDVQMTADAIALRPTLSAFALVSGDSDFVPVLQRMREANVRTVLVSLPLALSTLLRDAADEYLNLETVFSGNANIVPPQMAKPFQPTPRRRNTRRAATHRFQPPSQVIINKGEHLKPYLLIRKLLVAAKKEVTFIDPYIGAELFELLECLPARIVVAMITDKRKVPPDLNALMRRCRNEGRRIRVFGSRDVHDRYLRVDDDWWHSGHSFRNLGERVSQISRVETANRSKMRAIEQAILRTAIELFPAP